MNPDLQFSMNNEDEAVTSCLSSQDFDLLLQEKAPIWQRRQQEKPICEPILFRLLDLHVFSINDQSNKKDIHSNRHHWSPNGIRLYGVSHRGTSISVNVYGFSAYFFMTIPQGFNNAKCVELIDFINHYFSKKFETQSNVISRFDIVSSNCVRENMTTHSDKILKLCIRDHSLVNSVSDFIKCNTKKILLGYSCETFEEEVDFVERFLCDNNIHGCSWLEIKSNCYNILSFEHKKTICQVELEVSHEDVICKDYDSQCFRQTVPIRLLGFDIECYNRPNTFSDFNCDPVIAIGNVIGDDGKCIESLSKIVFVLGTSLKVEDVDVICFKSEVDLLTSWKQFVQAVDPDFFIGFNIDKFDLKYLTKRAFILKIKNYENFGREIQTSKDEQMYNFHGRIVFDMHHIVKKEFPSLNSYSLNNVSKKLLNDSKKDVDAGLIGKMYDESLKGRKMIYSYCLKDAILPIKIFNHLNIFQKYIEVVRVTRLPLNSIVRMGKINNNHFSFLPLLASARQLTHVLKKKNTYLKNSNVDLSEINRLWNQDYRLILSLIMEYNLCFSTLIHDKHVTTIPSETYNESPGGDLFFKKSCCQGILPCMLSKLTVQLKNSKRNLNNEKDKENRRKICCRIAALSSVLKSVPHMLHSKFCFNSRILIIKNVIAYNSVLNVDAKMELIKKYF